MVSPYTKLAKKATNDISIQEVHNVTRHYVKDTDVHKPLVNLFPCVDIFYNINVDKKFNFLD